MFTTDHKSRGFSFIEVLIALTIFAVGIMAIISLQGITQTSTDFSGNMSIARMLATDQIERLEGLAFSSTSLSNCSVTFCHKDIGKGANGTVAATLDFTGNAAANGRFRREWDVRQLDSAGSPTNTNVKKVIVKVSWTDTKGGASNASAQSFNRSLQMSSVKIQ